MKQNHDKRLLQLQELQRGNIGAFDTLNDLIITHEIYPLKYDCIDLLSEYKIFGNDIYQLYNDICECSIYKTMCLIIAPKFGVLNLELLKEAASRQDRTGKELIYIDEVCAEMLKILPGLRIIKKLTIEKL